MKTKGLILVILVISMLCFGIGSYIIISSSASYKNITMNEIIFEVPDSDNSVINQTNHYSIYNDSENGVAIYVFDSEGNTLNDMSEMVSFAGIRDANQVEAQNEQKEGYNYNYSETLKEYTYLCNYTHKNVFIITKSEDTLLNILKSMKLNENITLNISDNDNKNNESVSTGTTQKSKSTGTSSSSSSSVKNDEDPYEYSEDGSMRRNKKTGKKEYYFDGDGGGDGDWVEDW